MCIRDRPRADSLGTQCGAGELLLSSASAYWLAAKCIAALQAVCSGLQRSVSYTHLRAHETSAHL
eukprot:1324054-Alexandrium_andersonii.AAC.1